ncbi:YheV family putative metal-binding protein [Salinimonas sp. HHU 13199]|uniref:YheV family putative metal-binding protein n=1 Tax=Salinimonas profundi TaxID=2729140 RepID=A0ABR8LNL7_9ALTE|nr:YheV family putative zinc ribbon protein [Salinimonas profundi]MBD3585695.1 YheV family putative metal-binding protein [Salinimonas profundi]
MTNRERRRFIAGAICPKCNTMDTIMLYFENNVEKLKCVACDYQESQTDDSVKEQSKGSDNIIGVFKPE